MYSSVSGDYDGLHLIVFYPFTPSYRTTVRKFATFGLEF